jgi:chaperone required for assembly of F1-ATPase
VKRFYKEATAEAVAPTDGGGWRVVLDGRGVKTAGSRPQVVPTLALAEALAGEWQAQGETIDPAGFRFRDLVDYAIDAVAPSPAQIAAELLPYAETDTLCYRADPDEPLYKRQLAVWEPLLAGIEARLGVPFVRISGIVHKPQPPQTLARLVAELEAQDPFTLAALKILSSLAASLTIALEAIRPGADARALWDAANLEEDWQAELWGEDAEALAHRAIRFEAFQLAMRLATLAREHR